MNNSLTVSFAANGKSNSHDEEAIEHLHPIERSHGDLSSPFNSPPVVTAYN